MANSRNAKVKRAEAAVVRAAMRFAEAGKGFVFKDGGRVSDVGHAMTLERACAKLKEARKL